MKKKLMLLLFAILPCFLFAQQGYKAVYAVGGLSYKHGGNVMIGLDLPNNFFNSFDISAQYYFYKSEKNILGNLAYKPCLSKGINYMFRGKIGAGVGTTTHKTIFCGVGGFEYIYAITPIIDFLWLTDGGYYFNTREKWRVNTYIGFRINI